MSTPVQFKDFNFKLAVINVLMYEKEALGPKFDVWKFAENYKEREIDPEEEGYDPIPEVAEYFEKLEIPADLLPLVDEIEQDGGNSIFMQICPFWDGEDDGFNITSAEDADLLPNLKRIVLMSDDDELFAEFERRGIKAEPL